MRILIAYPGPTHSTFDVAAGYEKALRNLGHIVYGYPYHKWLNFYGEVLLHWESLHEQYQVDRNDVVLHSSLHLVIAAVEFVPDVVIIVSGSALHKHAYDLLARMNLPLVLLLTESPYEDDMQAQILELAHIAHAFTNECLSVERLTETGVPVTYLPHSFDPEIHKPIDVNGEYQSDVFFHGTLWPERSRLLDSLAGLPFNLRVTGLDLGEPVDGKHLIDNDELARWYNGAKICLNHHRTFRKQLGDNIGADEAISIGPRAYEIAACGAFQLCDVGRQELYSVFGGSVPTYKDAEDLNAKVSYYMGRPDARRDLAELARLRVQGCTFEDRAREIVEPILRRL